MPRPDHVPLRIHHVAISTTNFDRLRLFYVETLGLPVVGGFPDHDILFLDAGGTLMELVGEAPSEPGGDASAGEGTAELSAGTGSGEAASGQRIPEGFNRRGWQHLAWDVPDVDAAYDDFVARGVVGHSPPESFPPEAPSLRIAFLRDPDGNLLELVQTVS